MALPQWRKCDICPDLHVLQPVYGRILCYRRNYWKSALFHNQIRFTFVNSMTLDIRQLGTYKKGLRKNKYTHDKHITHIYTTNWSAHTFIFTWCVCVWGGGSRQEQHRSTRCATILLQVLIDRKKMTELLCTSVSRLGIRNVIQTTSWLHCLSQPQRL